ACPAAESGIPRNSASVLSASAAKSVRKSSTRLYMTALREFESLPAYFGFCSPIPAKVCVVEDHGKRTRSTPNIRQFIARRGSKPARRYDTTHGRLAISGVSCHPLQAPGREDGEPAGSRAGSSGSRKHRRN